MEIAFAKRIISLEIGTPVAGYGVYDVSMTKLDERELFVLCLDNGMVERNVSLADKAKFSAIEADSAKRENTSK